MSHLHLVDTCSIRPVRIEPLWSQKIALHVEVVAIKESQFIASTFSYHLNKKFGQKEKRIIFKLLPKDGTLELYKKSCKSI